MTYHMNSNFRHLSSHGDQLLKLGLLAERYFTDDPNTCLLKLRQLAELLAQETAANLGMLTTSEESQFDLIGRLLDVPNLKGVIELKFMPLPLPIIRDQQEINIPVEKMMKRADILKKHNEKCSGKVDSLNQFVLSKSFRSELVAQVTATIPALERLKKIRVSRAHNGQRSEKTKNGKVQV